jgi:predicted lactoylglutathione lyase
MNLVGKSKPRASNGSFCYDMNMNDKIVINLPVLNTKTSASFFEAIKFEKNQELSDENATCFNLNSLTVIALLSSGHFAQATKGDVTDTAQAHEVLVSINKGSTYEVDELVRAAISAGAKELHEPIKTSDLYGRSFSDLDGHQWNIFSNL